MESQARRKLTLIVIDRSFSMRANGHMERAKDEAHKLIRDLPGGFWRKRRRSIRIWKP